MSNHVASFETIIESVDALSPAELDALQARISRSRQKQMPATKRGGECRVFEIPYDKYLRFSDQEREDLQWRVYREHHEWAETELKTRRAQWMIVCCGEIVEFSRTLNNFPTPEKLQAIGKERGYIPFVFVPKPLIEESAWSTLDEEDFYPTLRLNIAGTNAGNVTNFSISADLDTGSPHLFVDYDRLFAEGVIDFRPNSEAYIQQHLGQYYRFHIMPIQIVIIDEKGKKFESRLHAYCVRDWAKSSLCLVNPNRQALAGRNVLLRFPVKVELDGQKRITRVSGKKTGKKKRQ
jgi:hypothetical protein